MTACRPVPLKHLNVTVTVTVQVVLFAISNQLHGVCHTAVKIRAITMKTMVLFLLPLVMVMTVVLVAAAAATTTTIMYMLALVTIGLCTSSNSTGRNPLAKCHCILLFHAQENFLTGTVHSKRPGCMVGMG